MWKNSAQVFEELASFRGEEAAASLALFACHKVLRGSVLTKDFAPYDTCAGLLTFSAYAEELFAEVPEVTHRQSVVDLKLAALALFYHQKPLLDFAKSDSQGLQELFSEALRTGAVLLPARFGRELYDKFNDDFVQLAKERASYLEHKDAVRLLSGTEQGNYQIGPFVMGPLGMVRVKEHRYIPPDRRVPLWHCADTGCKALHSVELRSFPHSFLHLANRLRAALSDRHGPMSEWKYPFHIISAEPRPSQDGRKFFDVPVLLADSLHLTELRQLLVNALASEDRQPILHALFQSRATDNWQGMSPDVIAEKLDHNEMMQLLMMISNKRLVEHLDRATAQRQIMIPLGEARRSKGNPPRTSYDDPRSTLSVLGVRPDRKQPLAFMAATIWKAYSETGSLADLEWRCRKGAGPASPSSPIDFMRGHDPSAVIRELVLPSRDVTLFLAESLNVHLPAFDDEETIISRFLWKFGFDLPRFDDRYSRFHNQLSNFREELLKSTGEISHDDRDRLRSRGVNVFVSLEAILEDLIAYNAWLFFSDHFITTGFKYRRSDALKAVSNVLGPTIVSGSFTANWSSTGHNTLGPLMVYLRALVKELSSRVLADREPLLRPTADLPHFDDKDLFVFRHTELWADTSAIEMKGYVEELSGVTARLEKAAPAEIRNGLDHFREEGRFPKVESMTTCELFVSDAVRLAEERRLLPIAMWLTRETKDNVGRLEYELADHYGRKAIVYGPSAVLGLHKLSFGQAFLVPSTNLIGHANSDLIFELAEESLYGDYWATYPRRQPIDAPTEPAKDTAVPANAEEPTL